MAGKSTLQLSREVGVNYAMLYSLIRDNLVPEPLRLGGRGAYVWMPEDVERVRQVLATKKAARRSAKA
ncbi:MAG TPA: hypothetical protein VN688_12485 [Gemmataceae bacterium]|nr:hypothetical protein [Gemmataceae bacterium]